MANLYAYPQEAEVNATVCTDAMYGSTVYRHRNCTIQYPEYTPTLVAYTTTHSAETAIHQYASAIGNFRFVTVRSQLMSYL